MLRRRMDKRPTQCLIPRLSRRLDSLEDRRKDAPATYSTPAPASTDHELNPYRGNKFKLPTESRPELRDPQAR